MAACGSTGRSTSAAGMPAQPSRTLRCHYGEQMARGEIIISAAGLEGGAVYALSRAMRESPGLAALVRPEAGPDRLLPLPERLARPRGKQSRSTFLRKSLSLTPAGHCADGGNRRSRSRSRSPSLSGICRDRASDFLRRRSTLERARRRFRASRGSRAGMSRAKCSTGMRQLAAISCRPVSRQEPAAARGLVAISRKLPLERHIQAA